MAIILRQCAILDASCAFALAQRPQDTQQKIAHARTRSHSAVTGTPDQNDHNNDIRQTNGDRQTNKSPLNVKLKASERNGKQHVLASHFSSTVSVLFGFFFFWLFCTDHQEMFDHHCFGFNQMLPSCFFLSLCSILQLELFRHLLGVNWVNISIWKKSNCCLRWSNDCILFCFCCCWRLSGELD